MVIQGKDVEDNKQDDKIWPQILSIFVVCLTSVTSGAQFAWTSPFIVKITNDTINYDITEQEASYFAIIHPVSTVVFSLFVPKLNDLLRRKHSVLMVAIPQILYWILTIVAKNVYVFYLARVLSGLGDALHFGAIPMYIGEIATPKVRGTWGNLVLFVLLGQFLINLVGQKFSVQETSYIGLVLPVLFIILMCFMPESPYYCAMKNMEEEGKKSLRFLRGKEDVEEEYLRIKTDIERQMSERGTWKELLCISSNRKALLAGVFLRFAQQFTGCGAIQSYTQFIFEKSGSSVSSGASSLITTGMLAGVSCFTGHIAEIFGRKKSFLFSTFTCAVLLLLESAYIYVEQETSIDVQSITWLPLTIMVFYFTASASGVTFIPTLMLGELFSSSIKTKGLGVLTISLGLFLFLANAVFYALNTSFGLYTPFLCFGIISIFSTVVTIFLVPETKGKTLEEIQQDLKKKRKLNKVTPI